MRKRCVAYVWNNCQNVYRVFTLKIVVTYLQ